MTRSLALLLCCLSTLVSNGWAVTEYTKSVSSVTSVTIYAAEHGIYCPGTGGMSIRVYNSSGVLVPPSNYTASIDNSCTQTFSFGSAFTGKLFMRGVFTQTSSSNDFAPVGIQEDQDTQAFIAVGSYCTQSSYCYRGSWGVLEREYKWYFGGQCGACTTTIRVWMNNGTIVFASSNSYGGSCIHVDGGSESTYNGDCQTQTGVSSFPGGNAHPILQCDIYHPNNDYNRWQNCTDYRGF